MPLMIDCGELWDEPYMPPIQSVFGVVKCSGFDLRFNSTFGNKGKAANGLLG